MEHAEQDFADDVGRQRFDVGVGGGASLRFHHRLLSVMAGAPGFEPGNGGIKIRCLTTWLRPNAATCPVAARTIAAAPGGINACAADALPMLSTRAVDPCLQAP
jgi:hypothetical protein